MPGDTEKPRRIVQIEAPHSVDHHLCGIDLECPSQTLSPDAISVHAQIAFGKGAISVDEYSIPLKLQQAYISVSPDGGSIDHRTAYGNVRHPQYETISVAHSKQKTNLNETSADFAAVANLSYNPNAIIKDTGLNLTFAKGRTLKNKSDEHTTFSSSIHAQRVQYKLNFWEITEPVHQFLNGVYVNPQYGPLAEFRCINNNISITFSLNAHPYHIITDSREITRMGDRIFQRRPNRDKIIKALIAKTLKIYTQTDPDQVTLSSVTLQSSLTDTK